jgi:hypothetical protein
MEAVRTSETSVNYEATVSSIHEDSSSAVEFLPLFLLNCFPIKRLNDVIKATVIIMIIYLVW